ncbi:MAG: pyridoxal-dependent decarboxylase [Acidimicrobiales bacterium]|nr:pyridoxal-dependent decarboxylase [Acidimicrobiales bacterium]
METNPSGDQLFLALADLAREVLANPRHNDDPVVNWASPEDLVTSFSTTVGLDFADHAPAHPVDQVLAAAQQVVEWSVHTSHPRFFNQNFAGPDPVAVAGDWLAAALNTTNATFEAAPVFTLMEAALLNKLAELAGFSTESDIPPGLFCPGGSLATLYALQLARYRQQPTLTTAGASAEPLAIFVSEAGHYTAVKSASLLGLGSEAVIKVATDAEGAMLPQALTKAIAATDRTPLAVIATAGTTVTAAFDPLEAIADLCAQHNIWLHVDGCYGGSALFSPQQRHRLAGVERADSLVWNLHKMMGMTQQCTVLLVQNPEQLDACFSTNADYLFQPDKLFSEYDSGDRTFQCARRVDALKLWLAWKAHGDQGFSARIDRAVAMADHARSVIEDSEGALVAVIDTGFTNVVFAWVPPELRPLNLSQLTAENRQRLHQLAPLIKARMQQAGDALLGYQPVNGLNTFRLLIMNPAVTPADVDAALGRLAHHGQQAWEQTNA